jgi:hypothetical protein
MLLILKAAATYNYHSALKSYLHTTELFSIFIAHASGLFFNRYFII